MAEILQEEKRGKIEVKINPENISISESVEEENNHERLRSMKPEKMCKQHTGVGHGAVNMVIRCGEIK